MTCARKLRAERRFRGDRNYDDDSKMLTDQVGSYQASFAYTDGAVASVTLGSGGAASTTTITPQLIQAISSAVLSADFVAKYTTNGNTTTVGLNSQGQVVTLILPNGGTQTSTLNSDGLPLTVTDPDGNVTSYTYRSSAATKERLEKGVSVRDDGLLSALGNPTIPEPTPWLLLQPIIRSFASTKAKSSECCLASIA